MKNNGDTRPHGKFDPYSCEYQKEQLGFTEEEKALEKEVAQTTGLHVNLPPENAEKEYQGWTGEQSGQQFAPNPPARFGEYKTPDMVYRKGFYRSLELNI